MGDVEYRELNRPGAPPVCAALRREVKHEEIPINGEFSYEDDLFAKSVGSHGTVRLKHCDGSSTVLPGRRERGSEPLFFDLRAGVVTWDTADSEYGAFPAKRGARLDAYNLRTHRREEWTLPNPAPGYAAGWSTHTANTVFWLPDRARACGETCRVETVYVYAARL